MVGSTNSLFSDTVSTLTTAHLTTNKTIGKSNAISTREVKNGLAVISVTSNTDSTVRFVNETGIIVKEYSPGSGRIVKDNPNLSVWTFYVTPSEYGQWTIVALNGVLLSQESITVEAKKQYDIILVLDHYLIANGKFNTYYTHRFYGGANSSLTEDQNGFVLLYSSNKSSTYATCEIQHVDIRYYDYLVFDGNARGYYASAVCPAFGLLLSTASGGSHSSFRSSTMIQTSRQSAFNSRRVLKLDIRRISSSSISVGLQEAGSAASPAVYGGIRCYNLYLTNTPPV